MFHERWLGRYLTHYPSLALVALSPKSDVIGYLVGSDTDPARTPLFADLPYFADFAPITARYPAQLHVNVAADWRGHSVGAALVEHFIRLVAAAGCPGVHVVTARGMRNVAFYAKLGFHEQGCIVEPSKERLILARSIAPQA